MKNKKIQGGNRRTVCFSLTLPAVLLVAFFVAFYVKAEDGDAYKSLIITEIMYDPEGNNSQHSKWIEFYNSGKEIMLTGIKSQEIYKINDYYICDGISKATNKCTKHYLYIKNPTLILKEGERIIVAANTEQFENDHLDLVAQNLKSALGITGSDKAFVKLCFVDDAGCGESVEYGSFGIDLPEGYSLEKKIVAEKNLKENWQQSRDIGGTPGAENSTYLLKKEDPVEIIAPEIAKVILGKMSMDEHIYPKMFADFAIEKKEDEKVTWTFGDGHRSYKAITKHKYEAVGTYAASVKVYKGKTNVVQDFVVTVEEYPRPKVRIVGINANPKGSDTKKETITIENKSKQKINLKGWSVATGWKKIVNHPIREDFEIKAGKEKELTRDKCAFTLVNSKDKIELRYPDGEVADEVKYKKGKDESVAEGEEYVKGKKGWKWEGGEEKISNSKLKITNENTKTVDQPSLIANQENTKEKLAGQSLEMQDKEIENMDVIEPNVVVRNEVALVGKNKIELAVAKIETKPKVLGAQNMREESGQYFFTPLVIQKHYAVAFVEKVLISANSWINDILNNL